MAVNSDRGAESPSVLKPQRVRLVDVAQTAGVAPSVVSRVLNADPTLSIRAETRARIVRAVDELGYAPNASARGLKMARTMTLGMVLPNLAYPVNAEVIRAAGQRASAAGYVMLLVDADEFAQTRDAYRRLLVEQRVDGLLIAGATTRETLPPPSARAGHPVVMVNRRVPGVEPSVTIDDAAGMALGVQHLVELGHSDIAHVAGPPDADTAGRRLEGFQAGMAAAGLAVPDDYVVTSTYEEQSGLEAMATLMSRPRRPTAVACWSLGAAIGALRAARMQGVQVPDEMSLIGFNEAAIAAYLEPPLTTIKLPYAELGERAVDCLLALIAGEPVTSSVIETAPIVVRRSSTAPPASPSRP